MNGRDPRTRPFGPAPSDPFDGVLIVDKPSGPTSHDIVDAIRRQFSFRKVGHGGTLDPQATGLLVLLLGRATKLSSHFLGSDKAYEGALRLGVSTDTQDRDGKVLREAEFSQVTREALDHEIRKRVGDMMQTPPMVSAAKVGGVPLYRKARRGETVEREPRLIHVYEFSLLDFDPPRAAFTIRCTKGTYVRTLCAEIGDALGCGACLDRLRRTQSGPIRIEDALAFEDLLAMDRKTLIEHMIPMSRFVRSARPD